MFIYELFYCHLGQVNHQKIVSQWTGILFSQAFTPFDIFDNPAFPKSNPKWSDFLDFKLALGFPRGPLEDLKGFVFSPHKRDELNNTVLIDTLDFMKVIVKLRHAV